MAAPTGLPRGPRLPAMVQTALLWRAPQRFLDTCRRRLGPVFTVRAEPFGTLVYVADPDLLREVFTGDPDVLRAGEGNSLLGPMMGAHSVLLLDEPEHMRQRKLMLPPFHGDAVRRYGRTMAEIAAAEVSRWRPGEELRLHPRMQASSLEVILRTVFGVEEHDRLAELRRLLPRLVDVGPLIALIVLRPGLGRVGPWRRYVHNKERVDALLHDEIARRRVAPDLDERTDVLSLLIRARDPEGVALTDVELRDELVTLLLAGHETTATGLAWAFERLVRHPDVLARARTEIVGGDGDEYLEAIVKETLRVRPVLFDVARTLSAPLELGGYRLPAGATVMPGIGLVQRDPALYEEPERFRPERFLDGAGPPSYAWIPFGGGTRRCLGAAFATLEMKIVLRTVLEHVELAAVDPGDERPVVRHITLTPGRGACVRVAARREAHREVSAPA